MQRIELEFQNDNLAKSDIELIDSYLEHKRFQKQKQKALRRDLQRDRINLKEKTVAMIEQQVEEQKLKLQKDIEIMHLEGKKQGLHEKLNEQKQDYEHKMKVIEEIKLQKQRQQEQQSMLKEAMLRKHADK